MPYIEERNILCPNICFNSQIGPSCPFN